MLNISESRCKLYVCVGQESCIIIVSAHVSGNYAQKLYFRSFIIKEIQEGFGRLSGAVSSSHGTYQNVVVMRFYEGTHKKGKFPLDRYSKV